MPSVEGTDDLLPLNKALLLKALYQLKESDTLESLRQRVTALKEELQAPHGHLRLIPPGSDTVDFFRAYLFDELDQMMESQTLERGLYYIGRFIKSITSVRTNGINDINLNRWKEYEDILTDSLWT